MFASLRMLFTIGCACELNGAIFKKHSFGNACFSADVVHNRNVCFSADVVQHRNVGFSADVAKFKKHSFGNDCFSANVVQYWNVGFSADVVQMSCACELVQLSCACEFNGAEFKNTPLGMIASLRM